jgi:hypothetical protein
VSSGWNRTDGTHQLLICADDDNILVENLNIINKETEALQYERASKSFRTEPIMKYTLTFDSTRFCSLQRVMVAKLARLTHKIAIQLHLVAKSCTICSTRSRRPVRKLWLHLSILRYVGRWSRIESEECVWLYVVTIMQEESHNIKTADKTFEIMVEFKYLGPMTTNQKHFR